MWNYKGFMTKEKNVLDTIKKVGFLILIFVSFSSLTFLFSGTLTNTLFEIEKNEYCEYPHGENKNNETIKKYQECEDKNMEIFEERTTYGFIIVSIISLISLSTIIFFEKKIESLISYGIFFGVGLNTIISLLSYYHKNSLLALLIGIILFGLIVYFINKNLKKNKKLTLS